MQMNRLLVAVCALTLAANALAQTTVTTTGGTATLVPVFTGTSTLGNSLIQLTNTALPGSTTINTPTVVTDARLYVTTAGSLITMRGLADTSWDLRYQE